ncbi:MAG: hypothetical protein AAF327_21970 [Cyanobacteria bacterium P01_A01_bin.37]
MMHPSLLSQFQGTLIGAAIADMMSVSPEIVGSDNRMSLVDNDMTNAALESPDETNGFGHLILEIISKIIPSDVLPEAIHNFPQRTNAAPGVSTARLPLAEAIALIPLALYGHSDVMTEASFTFRLQQLGLDSRFPVRLPLPSMHQVVVWTFMMMMNHRFHAETHLETLIKCLGDDLKYHSIIDLLRFVQDALQHRRGARWLLESLKSIGQTNLSQPTTLRHDDSVEPITEEAIAIGIVLYCLLSTPNQYNTAVLHLIQLLQKSTLSSDFISPACLLLGAFLGCNVGSHSLPSLGDSYQHHNNKHLFLHQQDLQRRWVCNHESLSCLGFLLWATWSGIDRQYLAKFCSQSCDGLEFTTAAPGVIRRFGN